ncbi:ribose transport system permease protein [Billgrantia gudaonensis]|uniref:Ribose transport system permease protein n=2 Tax=Billgrantia gudaonensis TaxID=376427 RepID=A0A1G8Z6B6_9GAMM|nr:ribose transport system permease protein [Halomonas gudaonensis]
MATHEANFPVGRTVKNPAGSRVTVKRWRLPVETLVLGLTLLLWVVMSLSTSTFFTANNLVNILRQVSVDSIIAFGVLFPILIRGIDLSVGSVTALSGVVCATLLTMGLPIPVAIGLTLLLGVAIGSLNAFSVHRLGIPAFIITLAGLQAYRGGAFLVSDGTSVFGLPKEMASFARAEWLGIPSLFWTMLVIGLILHFILSQTRTGRYMVAMGSNYESARRAGINIKRIVFFAYIVSSLAACIAGILLMSRMSIGSPTAAVAYELNAIAAAVVGGASLFGGRGSVLGTFIGALLFATIANSANLLGIDSFWQMIATGVLIAVVVYVDNLHKRRQSGLK